MTYLTDTESSLAKVRKTRRKRGNKQPNIQKSISSEQYEFLHFSSAPLI